MNTQPPVVLITGAMTGIGRLDGAVNNAGIEGQVGIAGASVHAASKHAVEGLTKSAALEGATAGVRVNAVAPGPIQTDMLDRFTGGNEEAKSGFLASDKARFLTGQCLAVDGGFTAQ